MKEANVHYRREQGFALIEINLDSFEQLFNSLDPAPFHSKDLDDDAVSYIVGAAEDFPLRSPLRIVLHVPQSIAASPDGTVVPDAIRNFFSYSLETERRKLRAELREGRITLAIGLAFLFVCIGLRQIVIVSSLGTFGSMMAEGLLISGWVAMWRPLDIFLYGWWPIRRRCRILEKLAEIQVDVKRRDLPFGA